MHLFGSHLIKKYFPEFRTPKDIDWVTNDITKLKTCNRQEEYYHIPCSPNREMTPNEIYTVKVSHAIYDIHWSKTMSDIRFLQINNCEIDKVFLNELREHWKILHKDKQRTNFNIEESEFFKDNVKREIPHDDLHKLFNPIPSYLKIVDGIEPIEEKFNSLSDSDKDNVCLEEAYVLAIERYYKSSFRQAYLYAQKTISPE